MSVRLGSLGQASAHDEHVVVRRRHAIEAATDDLAQLALDAISDDCVPDRLRDGKAEPRVARRSPARWNQ